MPAEEGEWGVLKVGCVNKDAFAPEQNKKLPTYLKPDPQLEIKEGDIMVSRANTRELLGLAAVAEKPRSMSLLCDKLFRFRVRQKFFTARFLVLLLRAKPSRIQIEASTNGASISMQNIGQNVIKNLVVSIPPIHEQEQITTHVFRQDLAICIVRHVCWPPSLALTWRVHVICNVSQRNTYAQRFTTNDISGRMCIARPRKPTTSCCALRQVV
jgi:type I restriction enzyme S subunit